MSNRSKLMSLYSFLAAAAILLTSTSCSDNAVKLAAGSSASLGNFTEQQLCDVITNPDLDEIIVHYEGFTVSFNPTMHLPNWVAWAVTREKIENGTVTREDNFRPDENVPGCATLADYSRSGYDRGHMAPAGDMKWSAKAMDESFYLTNICPQLNVLNNGAWKNLEEKCRTNAKRDSMLVIICGPVLTEGFRNFIGPTPVPVPQNFFKVVLTPKMESGAHAIGFIMPNGNMVGGMQAAAVSVDQVEKITGHNFFHLLPDDIENALESDNNFARFSTGKSSRSSR